MTLDTPIHEISIVSYENKRTPKLHKGILQNFERRNIQVIRRFVEQEHIRRLKHQLRDEHPRALAAGQSAHRLIEGVT
jgi:hypothetical protein